MTVAAFRLSLCMTFDVELLTCLELDLDFKHVSNKLNFVLGQIVLFTYHVCV